MRRRTAKKHIILPDPKFKDVEVTKFVNSLEKQLSGIVCELFGKMNDKASGVYDKLKTGMADSGGLGGLLDKGKTALASAV